MTPPRHIAPSTAAPVSIAPVAADPPPPTALKPPEPPQQQQQQQHHPHHQQQQQQQQQPQQQQQQQPAVAATDVIFVNGQAFNGRGYQVCGVANQRGRLCGRIGQCPFHGKKSNPTAKRPRASSHPDSSADAHSTASPTNSPTAAGARPPMAVRNAIHANIRQMDIPPQKSRFKRSWTTEEHRRFLQAMRRFGRGKWKEIAVDVKTRNANQCQSHAQKYFLRQQKTNAERKKKSIHDVTEEDVPNDIPPNAATAATAAAAAAAAAVWSPSNQLHVLAQRASQVPPVPIPASSMAALTGVSAPLQIRQVSSGVPLAPRLPIGQVGSSAMTIDPTGLASLAASVGIPAGANLGLSADAESLAQWGASVSTSSAAPTVPTVACTAGTNAGANPTHTVVFPMTSLGGAYASMVPSFMGSSLSAASGAAVGAPPPPQKVRVTVHRNGRLKGGMALILPKNIEEFFEQAQAKLQFDGMFSKVFSRSGGEITSVDEMVEDDMLWLSTGEDFQTPR